MDEKRIFSSADVAAIGKQLNINWQIVNPEEFLRGLNQELEHGTTKFDTNISDDDGLVLGKIVLAHLRQLPDYYTRLEQMMITARSGVSALPHYYGGVVRKIFLGAAVVMIISIPFLGGVVSLLGLILILVVLVLGILAGMTSPRHPTVIVSDMAIAVIGFVVFEFYAIHFYYSGHAYFFVATQLLSLLFLISIYYATKTYRGMLNS